MIGTAVATTLSLVGIYWIAFWLYRDYRVDQFRQSLFAIRDELFDFAADGNIGFDHAVYRGLRELINRQIRFGHRIRLMPGIFFTASLDAEERKWLSQRSFHTWWEEATNELDVPVARTLYGLKHRVDHQVQTHLIVGSSLLMFTLVPAMVLIIAAWLPVEVAKRAMNRLVESFEMAARDVGRAT